MLVLSHLDNSLDAARGRLQDILSSGKALESFRQNVSAQGGDARVCDEPARFLPLATESFKVESPRSGIVTKVNTADIGHAIAAIGGGRVRIDDEIDPSAGFAADVKIGDRIEAGDSIGAIYCSDEAKAKEAVQAVQACYEIGDAPLEKLLLVKEIINE
jgi:thymidine phosphorylase